MIDLHVHEGILPEARRETHLFRAVATVVVLDSLFFFFLWENDGWVITCLPLQKGYSKSTRVKRQTSE